MSLPTLVDSMAGRLTQAACDRRLSEWTARVSAHAQITIDLRAPTPLDLSKPCVVMSNHRSHYDIPVLYAVVGPSLRMVGKRELFAIPIFGRAIRQAGFVEVDRKNHERALESLERAKGLLSNQIPIWIAPEGTRSTTGKLSPFKKGGFVIAQTVGCPVLPITIEGTEAILPPGSIATRPGVRVVVHVHDAVKPQRFAHLDRKTSLAAFMAEVRGAIESPLRSP